MIQFEPVTLKKERGLIYTWSITFLIFFPLLIFIGFLMRMGQSEMKKLLLANFYSLMTLHGIGMIAVMFSFAFAIIWYLIGTRYTRLNTRIGYAVYFIELIAMAGLTIGILIGKFGPGWFLLYPLPFKSGTWLSWSTGVTIISLIVLGIAWLIGILHLLYSLTKEFRGFKNLLGWQYFRKKENYKELPSTVLVTTISLVPAILAFIIGAVMLIMYLLQFIQPSLKFDPLLLQNITLFFGHTFVSVTLFCGVAWVYELLPEFTGQKWKTNKVLVYFWNATFLFILIAYFQNLYSDFVEPVSRQYSGQMLNFLSAIPASIITVFCVINQYYHSKIKWSLIPLMLLFGIAAWLIAGFAATVESSLAIYKALHNTLWVPGHLHTNMLMGVTLFIFAFLFYLFFEKGKQYGGKTAKTGFWLFIFGGYGFVLIFFLEGLSSIPRRYARYTGIGIKSMHDTAVQMAQISVFFVILLFIGLLIMYFSLLSIFFKKKD
jgi:cytochrome c oxidase subunit 1